MSDNEDLLGDDLGDQSLADYNLGNEEEEQLLADDYDSAGPQNVPTSIGSSYREPIVMGPPEYTSHLEYNNQPPIQYQAIADTECVVPNITVEVPNAPMPEVPTYAPYEPPVYEEHAVPPAIPAAPVESPQIVPSDMNAQIQNGDLGGPRERFISERPPGAQRLPQVRDIPDTLDKVVIPRGGFPRGRTSWRNPQYAQRFPHPYRRNNVHRGNFNQRPSFPPPQLRPSPPHNRPEIHPEMRPEIRPEMRPDIRPDIRPELRPEIRPDMRMEPPNLPPMGPEISPERPLLPQDMPPMYRPPMERPPFMPRFQFRPHMEERPQFGPVRQNFEPRPVFYRPGFPPRQFAPPMREIVPNASHMPQVTIRQAMPMPGPSMDKVIKEGPREPEVRMLPVPLPANLPPRGLAGKKVLINPHFKGNFQPPVEGLPVYIPTRIQKSPPLSPTIENKFGPVKDIDDAAERFIAEQRNALARAAVRKYSRRSPPQRYIENTTIEIENELAAGGRRRSHDDDDLLRRQEEFINANRAGLRRRMRSPSPVRRSVSPRRSPDRRPRPDTARHSDEDSEYKRRLREQESLRERVLRAKEVRRRKNALQRIHGDRERENQEKEALLKTPEQAAPPAADPAADRPARPDTTRASPPRAAGDAAPAKDEVEVNSTCEALTPPTGEVREALTPPLPGRRGDSDDDLDLILGDIDGILSDDDDSGRFKDNSNKPEPQKSKPQIDLRTKLPPKSSSEQKKQQRQKIVFTDDRDEKPKKKDKSPPRRAVVTSSTVTDDFEPEVKKLKVKPKQDSIPAKSRQRITYEKEQADKEKDEDKKSSFSNRRVILQRKSPKEKSVFSRIEVKADVSHPGAGIFSRAVRTAINPDPRPAQTTQSREPAVHVDEDSEDEDEVQSSASTARVSNLPPGITDTRLRTLAGNELQSLILDKEDRTAKIIFKSSAAAENFKKKFNNKMVAASRLTVTLH
ncbi:LOW QUALITY PROTEIN: titin-like [Spodoptera litura]|uniref:LOW QUALITY PROTEIN: titin-like n=1 Tax=Spodoptera litura TaxID=69820 RepID=A0A9J7EX85_SPOLT|nr:LOW QUALITY PROTEIN: titin-like [Spodoptera litura]